MTAKRGGLGKGLDSLIKENKTAKHTAPVKKEVVECWTNYDEDQRCGAKP